MYLSIIALKKKWKQHLETGSKFLKKIFLDIGGKPVNIAKLVFTDCRFDL